MGNQCCVREENKDLANLNIDMKRNDKLKVDFEKNNSQSNLENSNLKDTIHTGRIEINIEEDKINNNEEPELKTVKIKQNLEELYEKEKIEEKDEKEEKEENDIVQEFCNDNAQNSHNPPYWNESTNDDLENLMLEISDEKSHKIFEFLNDIRIEPEKYKEEAKNQGLFDLISKAENNKKEKFSIPNFLIRNESCYYQLREDILVLNTTPMSDDERNERILDNYYFKTFKDKKIDCIECPIDNYKESVWSLLRKNESKALDDILTSYIDYCVICAMPIKDSYNMKVFFLLLSN